MPTRLADKIAVVTGAGGGIGRAYCLALAREGAQVVAADINRATAQATAAAVQAAGGRSVAESVDIADMDAVTDLAERVQARLGGVDILVNNAAMMAEIPMVGL